jgi:hypothetical protein
MTSLYTGVLGLQGINKTELKEEEEVIKLLNLIKGLITHSISPKFYSWTDRRGSSNMVSESGGLEFEPWPRIFRCM